MPTPSITLHRLVNRNPAVYEASYGDKRVEVRLDMSAILMLERQRNYQDLDRILTSLPKRVADAAQKLMEMRQRPTNADKITVTITALDMV